MTRVGNKRGRPADDGESRPKRMKEAPALVETQLRAGRAGRKRPASDEEPRPTPKKRMKTTVAVDETPEDAPSADSITPESITPTLAVVETVETPAEPSKVDYVMLTMEIIKLLTYMQTFNFPIYDIFPEDKFKYLDEKYNAYREYSRLNNYNNNLLQFLRNSRDPEEGGVNDEERKRFAEYVCEEALKALNAEKQPKDSGRRHCAGCGDCLPPPPPLSP
jgi:hypothetical protein